MPRKGPKKVTRRDDRDLERRADRTKLQAATVRAKTEERALVVYKAQSNPNIPSNKGERRALRQALSAEGISMERWSSGNFDECFFHIAKDRYVNNRYPTVEPCDQDEEEDAGAELEADPWLQMYLHLPVDYREKVSDLIENVNPPEAPSKPKSTKMSRRQAKDLAEGVVVPSADVSASASVEDFNVKVVDEEVETKVPFAADLFKVEVPTGAVSIQNTRGETLCADAAGRVEWRSISGAQLGSVWTLQPAASAEGKFTLRSAHGLYLSHCMLWGFVADRTAASTWEHFEVAMCDEGVYKVKSWRGVFMNCSGNKVVPTSNADVNSNIKIERVV